MASLVPEAANSGGSLALDEVDLIRSTCQDSFYTFVQEFWHIVTAEPPVWNWHIEFLCDELQEIAERVFAKKPKKHDLCINISPGTTKSTIISIMFPAWVWTRMPSARFICGSHTEMLSFDLSRKCRTVIKSAKYAACWPSIELREDQDTKAHWENSVGGDRLACTVGGKSPIGFHAHFLIIDDPLDPQKAVSDIELKKANDWMQSTLFSRKVDKAVTPTILVMQRLHQDDPSGRMLAQPKGVRHVCLPAELAPGATVLPVHLKRKYVDGLMDPLRLGRIVLDEAMAQGEYYYAGQFLQNPVPLGGGMFKVDKVGLGTPPINRLFKRYCRYWDKAATAGGGAWTVGALLGETLEGHYWILDIIRVQLNSADREKLIKQTAILDGKHVTVGVEEEGGSGGKESAEMTVKMLRGWVVKTIKPSSQQTTKAIRADPFSTQVNYGNVSMRVAEWNKTLIEEMRYFPNSRYKDQIDALSGAFTVLTKGRTRISVG